RLSDNTGAYLTFTNRLILSAAAGGSTANDGSAAAGPGGQGGTGCYVCGGRYEAIRWMQPAPDAPLSILTDDETLTLAAINPGRSYVAVVNGAMAPYFRIDGKAVLSSAG
ncbi:MAG: hypothetical protein HDT27_08020, partial [Subdoligranulum sp.]|nr:hypothetical protein [Subdoligranulum sp.]